MNCCQVPTVIKSCFLIYLLKKDTLKKGPMESFYFKMCRKHPVECFPWAVLEIRHLQQILVLSI